MFQGTVPTRPRDQSRSVLVINEPRYTAVIRLAQTTVHLNFSKVAYKNLSLNICKVASECLIRQHYLPGEHYKTDPSFEALA